MVIPDHSVLPERTWVVENARSTGFVGIGKLYISTGSGTVVAEYGYWACHPIVVESAEISHCGSVDNLAGKSTDSSSCNDSASADESGPVLSDDIGV